MEYYLVSPLLVTHAQQSTLTYESTHPLRRGQIVTVSVGKKQVPAVVLQSVEKPSFQTKPVTGIVEQQPLPESLLLLHNWLSEYYATHPVAVWQTMLPRGLGKKRREQLLSISSHQRNRTNIVLNPEQLSAVEKVWQITTGTTLVHGITGSGKTEVYIELARRTVADGQSVIILVPEIGLTSQIIAEFTPHFANLVVTHSTMTEAQRHLVWRQALTSSEPMVVIGPRSALFTPLSNLGLVVIDECHEPSFKQEQSPRYSALRAASMLTRFAGARLVLGSATPNIADYYVAAETKTSIAQITKPARKATVKPTVHLIDMTKKAHFTRHPFFSNELLKRIQETIASSNQVLIFHNRRGSAPMTICDNCSWSAACPRCFVPLTLHADQFELRCHLCNYTERVPTACPVCGNASIIHKGIGTKRIAEELGKLFPTARIARFDGDTETGQTLDKHYQALYDGNIDIIIGTQVIAKGLDLPKLRLVGIVQADSGLSLPDYQSTERVFQLLAQVSGRVGRNEHESHVVVQSYQPAHPSVINGIAQNYTDFYTQAIQERQRAGFPPYSYLLKLVCVYKTEASAIKASRELAQTLHRHLPSHASLLGPTPAFYERVRDTYRWQIIVKSTSRKELIGLLQHVPTARWQYELDPVSLL
jgi:primosomal protein N' (replication factor Y)